MGRTRRIVTVAIAAVLITMGFASAGSAAPVQGSGNFCNGNVDTGRTTCFGSEAELRTFRAAATDYDLVAVYNWIDYNQGGGVYVWSSYHGCTADRTNRDIAIPELSRYYANKQIPQDKTYSSLSVYVSNPSNCRIRLYESPNYGGDSSALLAHCTHLAYCTNENWYDRARSFVLT